MHYSLQSESFTHFSDVNGRLTISSMAGRIDWTARNLAPGRVPKSSGVPQEDEEEEEKKDEGKEVKRERGDSDGTHTTI